MKTAFAEDFRIEALLAERSPLFRRLVLMKLCSRPADDREVVELTELGAEDSLVGSLATSKKTIASQPFRKTLGELRRLGYLGIGPDDPRVKLRADLVFSQQSKDGSWSIEEFSHGERLDGSGYTMVPLQTALPLHALAAAGHATDSRSERGYQWLLGNRLDDGAWPTGRSGGVFGRVAGYRRLAHSRWGCRSNTLGAVTALACHPVRSRSEEARKALDLVLGSIVFDAASLGFELARVLGVAHDGGMFTYYGKQDAAHLLSLASRVGGFTEDPRIGRLVEFVTDRALPGGLIEHPSHPHLSRWLTFDLLCSLEALRGDVTSHFGEAQTPFQPYPRGRRRY